MDDPEFCVVCGATDRPLTDGVCADCAADRTVLATVPRRVVITICPTCGARRLGRHWTAGGGSHRLTEADLTPHVQVPPDVGLRRVEWEETSVTPTVREYAGRAHVGYRGVDRTVPLATSVRLDARSCPTCSRKSGRFFTATLQIRGPADGRGEKRAALHARLEAEWERLLRESRPDWRDAVSWLEERPEGLDCFFTDSLAARGMARLGKSRFGASLTESASLFGRKDGRDVFRVTFCLRFPRTGPAPAAVEQ